MNSAPTSTNVYLDANFLVAYLLSSHADSKKAQKIFAKILIGNNKMLFSPLTVDELMHGIYKTLRDQERINGSLPDKSHRDYLNDIKQAVKLISEGASFSIIQFEIDSTKGCLQAVENVDKYNFRPRDAFHLAYMQDHKIKYIITNDTKFDRATGIKRVSF